MEWTVSNNKCEINLNHIVITEYNGICERKNRININEFW